MKKTLKLLMLLIVIISCNQGSRITKCYNEETREYIVDTLPYNDLRDYLKLQITKNIDSLINEIKNEDCLFLCNAFMYFICNDSCYFTKLR